MKQTNATDSIAKYFSWIAWLIAIAILIFVFQDLLDRQWNPNSEPQLSLSASGNAEVRLLQNRQGHYVVTGTINEQQVQFLLDTGATEVSIPAGVAKKLQLPRYERSYVQTANGATAVYQTRLQQLSIGNIYLYDIAANINPSMQGNEILLGMSALKKVEFQQTGNQLILRER